MISASKLGSIIIVIIIILSTLNFISLNLIHSSAFNKNSTFYYPVHRTPLSKNKCIGRAYYSTKSFPCCISTINRNIRTQKLYLNRYKIIRVSDIKSFSTSTKSIELCGSGVRSNIKDIESKLGKGESPELNTASSRTSLKVNLFLIVLFSSQNIIGGFKFREICYNIKLTVYNLIFKYYRARHACGIMFNNCNITPNSILLPILKKFIGARAYSGENHYLFGKSRSEETKLKISLTSGSPVEVQDIETNTKINYITVKKAAEGLSCSV